MNSRRKNGTSKVLYNSNTGTHKDYVQASGLYKFHIQNSSKHNEKKSSKSSDSQEDGDRKGEEHSNADGEVLSGLNDEAEIDEVRVRIQIFRVRQLHTRVR